VKVLLPTPKRDMRRGVCSFCRRKVSRRNGFICFASIVDGQIRHPGWGSPVAYFSHAKCSSDLPDYCFEIRRVTYSSIYRKYGLLTHIENKCWYNKIFGEALNRAAEIV
jgi:hypothetical protein